MKGLTFTMMRSLSLRVMMISALSAALVLPACKGKEQQQEQSRTQTTTSTNTNIVTNGDVADGLDLSRIPDLVKEVKNGEELEKQLNESGINNLDLNGDGKIDYLNVEEFREDLVRGFILFTNENNERTDIAKIDLQTEQQTTQVSVQGNPQHYGANAPAYHSSFPLGQILLAAWLFDMARPRYFHPPYYAGRYPSYYRSRPPLSRTLYRSRVSSNSFKVNGKSLGSTAVRRTGSTPTRFGRSSTSNNRTMTGGSSFSTTGQKRPGGSSTSTMGSSSTTSRGSFGSSSSRAKPGFRFGSGSGSSGSGFGSSSSRSSSGSSFGSSSSRSSSGSSFGSSSRRSSSGSSSRRRR